MRPLSAAPGVGCIPGSLHKLQLCSPCNFQRAQKSRRVLLPPANPFGASAACGLASAPAAISARSQGAASSGASPDAAVCPAAAAAAAARPPPACVGPGLLQVIRDPDDPEVAGSYYTGVVKRAPRDGKVVVEYDEVGAGC